MASLADLGTNTDPQRDFGGSGSFDERVSMPPFDWNQYTGGVTGQKTGTVDGSGGLQGQAAFDAFGRGLMATGGQTVADLQAYVQQWNAQNPSAQVTLGGSKGDKVYGPGGEFWNDAVIAAGEGGRGFSWGAYGGGASGGASGGAQGPYNFATDDPSYAWRLNQGLESVLKQKAAQGVLRTGGTLKDLTDYAQGAASTEYGNAFGRKFSLASLGENAAAQTGNFGSQYGAGGANSIYGAGNANSAGSIAQGNIWGNYLNNLGQR